MDQKHPGIVERCEETRDFVGQRGHLIGNGALGRKACSADLENSPRFVHLFAREAMGPLMRHVDVVIANEEDLQSVLGVKVPGTDVTSGQLNIDGFREAAQQVTRDFGPPTVAVTLRESLSASDNGWSALLWEGATKTLHRSQRYDVRLIDRIGGGDSFAGGLIYGLVTGRKPEEALRFAVASSALKQSIPGDFNRVSVEEVDKLAGGDASGRVQR